MAASTAKDELGNPIPKPGEWPVDPQEDFPISEDRIWVDGCFDFSHHGHAGALLQARRLGQTLFVGIHNDEEILANKGPTVMNLEERCAAVDACRWSTLSVPHAPYVTTLPWISHYGCKYVVHGDDITSDSDGNDCYRFVKQAGRFKVVKRTPGISTTDLVGRMLLCTKTHHIKNLEAMLDGTEGDGNDEERSAKGKAMRERIQEYASDESGIRPGPEVWTWRAAGDSKPAPIHRVRTGSSAASGASPAGRLPDVNGKAIKIVDGKGPKPGQRIIYVDGAFDLFTPGHIEFLKTVLQTEEAEAKRRGWFAEAARKKRIEETGRDYGPTFLIAGVHDDETVNFWKGVNYPIMNIFERGLCVLQCVYVHAVLFNAPLSLPTPFLSQIPYGRPAAVYHGLTTFMPTNFDPYTDAKKAGILREVTHKIPHVNAGEIVDRILKARTLYEERQRIKGVKGIGEEGVRRREEMEQKAAAEKKERQKKWREIERQYSA